MSDLFAASTGASFAAISAPALARALVQDAPAPEIPKVPGVLAVNLKRRRKVTGGPVIVEETVGKWKASETAIIICDMWADHPCAMAAHRVDRMAPRMNEVISLARDLGVAIVHSPSSGIHHYENTPFRARVKRAKASTPPQPIKSWCYLDPEKEPPLPVVDNVSRINNGVTGCDDPVPRLLPDCDRHQHPAIKMAGYDVVSADGPEIWNFLEQEGRKHIVLMGVHTNMCVLGRPFGIRQLTYLGKSVALCRDLTDALYDPRDEPHVSHKRGTEMIIEHIETHWCPSLLGADLTKVEPGSDHVSPASKA
ncbi:isochorismatase family protein [bacterium]|nr:isochorismatase family protein [bacterium]